GRGRPGAAVAPSRPRAAAERSRPRERDVDPGAVPKQNPSLAAYPAPPYRKEPPNARSPLHGGHAMPAPAAPTLDRRAFMAYFSSIGLGGTLLPGVLWAQIQQEQRIT